jgi:hypothetical protein
MRGSTRAPGRAAESSERCTRERPGMVVHTQALAQCRLGWARRVEEVNRIDETSSARPQEQAGWVMKGKVDRRAGLSGGRMSFRNED